MNKEITQSGLISLLEQAANASTEGITVSDLTEEDGPLIYINEGFERLTGYTREEVVGKNCRFLQGKDSDPEAVDEIRHAIRNGIECTVELLNYKKDGTPFWNRLSITPLKNNEGEVTHYVGVQSDITELKETKERLERANKDLESFYSKITEELDQASKAQQFMLPYELPDNRKIKFGARFEPMDRIGGDFYDIIELQNGVYGILIADVTGHGIPAALLTFMTSLAFKNSVHKIASTARVVSNTNKKLIEKMPQGAFITMFYAIYDSNTRVLTYTRAGHPQGFIVRPSTKEVIPLTTEGSLVGVFTKKNIIYGEANIKLMEGDKLIMYTDAILEARNDNKEMIGMENFIDFLVSNCSSPISTLLDKVYQFGIDFSGKETYDDDFTVVGFEVRS